MGAASRDKDGFSLQRKPSGFQPRGHPASLGLRSWEWPRCWKGEQGHLGWEVEKGEGLNFWVEAEVCLHNLA